MENRQSTKAPKKTSQLMNLFKNELKGVSWVEKALKEAIENATSKELNDALNSHLTEADNEANREEQVFEPLKNKKQTKHDLINGSKDVMKSEENGANRNSRVAWLNQM